MEINVDLEVLILGGILGDCFLGSPDSWVVFLERVAVEPVQVLSKCVKSVVASSHTIRVEGWDNFEHKIFPEKTTLFTFEICDEIKCAV